MSAPTLAPQGPSRVWQTATTPGHTTASFSPSTDNTSSSSSLAAAAGSRHMQAGPGCPFSIDPTAGSRGVTGRMRARIVGAMDGRVLLVAVAGIAAAGCGSGARPDLTARIVGGIYYHGGPASIGHRKPLRRSGSVRAVDRTGRVVAQATVGEGQRYTLHLAPGHYRVEAKSGDAFCRPTWVSAPPHRTAMASVYCNVK
jgi:hypothetical protein